MGVKGYGRRGEKRRQCLNDWPVKRRKDVEEEETELLIAWPEKEKGKNRKKDIGGDRD